MALIDREVGVAVAATTALLSPRARDVARKGAVYGLAGVLKVGDVVIGTARGAARGATEGGSSSNGAGAEAEPVTPNRSGGAGGRGTGTDPLMAADPSEPGATTAAPARKSGSRARSTSTGKATGKKGSSAAGAGTTS